MKTVGNKKAKITWKDWILGAIYGPAIIAQIILVFFFYNYYSLDFLIWIGWGVFAIFFIIGGLPRYSFKKYGGVEEGKNFIHTTKLVDRGIYALIRHPYWLCWILLSVSLTLMSQHIIMVILTVPAISLVYFETYKLDKGLVQKFGNDYKLYKRKVPRMNIILGIIKNLIRRKSLFFYLFLII